MTGQVNPQGNPAKEAQEIVEKMTLQEAQNTIEALKKENDDFKQAKASQEQSQQTNTAGSHKLGNVAVLGAMVSTSSKTSKKQDFKSLLNFMATGNYEACKNVLNGENFMAKGSFMTAEGIITIPQNELINILKIEHDIPAIVRDVATKQTNNKKQMSIVRVKYNLKKNGVTEVGALKGPAGTSAMPNTSVDSIAMGCFQETVRVPSHVLHSNDDPEQLFEAIQGQLTFMFTAMKEHAILYGGKSSVDSVNCFEGLFSGDVMKNAVDITETSINSKFKIEKSDKRKFVGFNLQMIQNSLVFDPIDIAIASADALSSGPKKLYLPQGLISSLARVKKLASGIEGTEKLSAVRRTANGWEYEGMKIELIDDSSMLDDKGNYKSGSVIGFVGNLEKAYQVGSFDPNASNDMIGLRLLGETKDGEGVIGRDLVLERYEGGGNKDFNALVALTSF